MLFNIPSAREWMDGKRRGGYIILWLCACRIPPARPGPARPDRQSSSSSYNFNFPLFLPSFLSSCSSPPLQLKSIDTQPTALEEEEEKTQKFLTFLFSWNYHWDIYEGARHHHDDGDDPTDDCIYTH